MPVDARRSHFLQIVAQYEDRLNKDSVPAAMSRLWLGGYPNKEANDTRTGELLKLWGLNLVRRRAGGHGWNYHPSIAEFRDSLGRRYFDHLHELYYGRFIDIHGRLWVPATLADGRYIDDYVGNLRQFEPSVCGSWHELANWITVLEGT